MATKNRTKDKIWVSQCPVVLSSEYLSPSTFLSLPYPASLGHTISQPDYSETPTAPSPSVFPLRAPIYLLPIEIILKNQTCSCYAWCSKLFKWNRIQDPWYNPWGPVWRCFPPISPFSQHRLPAPTAAATPAAFCFHKRMNPFPSSGLCIGHSSFPPSFTPTLSSYLSFNIHKKALKSLKVHKKAFSEVYI